MICGILADLNLPGDVRESWNYFRIIIRSIVGVRWIALDRWMWSTGYEMISCSAVAVIDGILFVGPGDIFILQNMSSTFATSYRVRNNGINLPQTNATGVVHNIM